MNPTIGTYLGSNIRSCAFITNIDLILFCRCKIEQEYAQKLRRLTKNYLPKQKGDDYKFTGIKAFSLMLNEINDLAGQHELIAENLSTAVVSDLTTLIRSLKDDRRKQLQVNIVSVFTLAVLFALMLEMLYNHS